MRNEKRKNSKLEKSGYKPPPQGFTLPKKPPKVKPPDIKPQKEKAKE